MKSNVLYVLSACKFHVELLQRKRTRLHECEVLHKCECFESSPERKDDVCDLLIKDASTL